MLIRILAIAFTAAPLITVEAEKIVMIGDSLSEYSKQTIDKFCDTAVVTNRGAGGSTAEQWLTQDDESDMYIPKAIKTKAGACFPVIFVSLGGNDQLEKKCKLEPSTVQTRITSALNQIEKTCPNAKIYMVGYPTPRKDFEECAIPITGTGTNKYLNAPVKAACEASSKCTYEAATNTGGGTDSSPSTGEYHVDVIHFNARGYCKLWNSDTFRTLMSCQGAKTDCSKVEVEEEEGALEEGAMAGVALSAMA